MITMINNYPLFRRSISVVLGFIAFMFGCAFMLLVSVALSSVV